MNTRIEIQENLDNYKLKLVLNEYEISMMLDNPFTTLLSCTHEPDEIYEVGDNLFPRYQRVYHFGDYRIRFSNTYDGVSIYFFDNTNWRVNARAFFDYRFNLQQPISPDKSYGNPVSIKLVYLEPNKDRFRKTKSSRK